MSSTVTVSPAKGVRGIGLVSIIAGIVLIVAGIATWIVVSNQLSAENITVSDDANMMAGRHVNGPLTAYAQAEVINKHALEASGGATYAELDQDDPTRQTVMTASFLRASLFTSVVAFGVAALVVGLGVLFLLLGAALRRLAGGPSIAIESPGLSSAGDLSDGARHAAPAAEPPVVAPTAPPVRPEPVEPPTRTSTLTTPAAEARAAAASEAPAAGTAPAATQPVAPAAAPKAPGASPEAAPPSSEAPAATPTGDEPRPPTERRGDTPTT